MRRYTTSHVACLPALLAALCFATAGAQPDDDPILAEGEPPLRQSDVGLFVRLIGFAFEAELTGRQAQRVSEHLVTNWGQEDELLPTVAEARATWEQISQMTGARRDVARLSVRDDLLKAAGENAAEPLSDLHLTLFDARSPIVMTGDPPLRRGSVEALISLLEWLSSEATGAPVELTEVERDEVRAYLSRQYTRAAPGDRGLLAHMEHTHQWMRLKWEQADADQQTNFRMNLADLFGVAQPLLTAPYTGEVATWQHPDGLFSLDYPGDWPARYGALPEEPTASGWSLVDVTVLGEAPSDALELNALPTAGTLVFVGVLPEEARAGRMTFHEAALAFAAEILAASGRGEPLGEPAAAERAVLMAWRHEAADGEFAVYVSVVALDEPEGAAVLTLARAPVDAVDRLEPAFSRIIHSLRLGQADGPTFDDELELPAADELALDLLDAPLRTQMDLIEGLTSGIR